jgi:tRNA threonylcarbamoyladenosine biosynthesis protein TsaB
MADAWLGIETSTSRGGVAIVRGDTIIEEDFFPVIATHSEKLLPGIAELLRRTGIHGDEIEGIAVSAGPGSYTGLRIGLSTACGLAAGWGNGTVSVSTLRILAAAAPADGPILSCIKARKGEVFAAVFQSNEFDSAELIPPGVYAMEAVLEKIAGNEPITVVGNGQRMTGLPGNVVPTDPQLDSPSPSLTALIGLQIYRNRGFDDSPIPLYLRGFKEKAGNHVP